MLRLPAVDKTLHALARDSEFSAYRPERQAAAVRVRERLPVVATRGSKSGFGVLHLLGGSAHGVEERLLLIGHRIRFAYERGNPTCR